jgi:hypothetical protein
MPVNQDWNIPEPPDFVADRVEWSGGDGEPVEGVAVYIIDRAGEFTTKSKDELFIKFAPEASRAHFAAEWSPNTAVYFVTNLTKTRKGAPSVYTVAFYRSRSGDVILASCDCPARVRCKHIVRAWLKHADAEKTGFLPKL